MDRDLEGLIKMKSSKEGALCIKPPPSPEMIRPCEVRPPAPHRPAPAPNLKAIRKAFWKGLSKKQKRLANRMYQWLLGSQCQFREKYQRPDGELRDAFVGLIDSKLSQLKPKGPPPKHIWGPDWEKDLKARGFHDYLPKLTRMDVAIAMFSGGTSGLPLYALYIMGHQHYLAHFVLLVLDVDDKKKTGRADELLQRLDDKYPTLRSNCYTESSPGGYGRHVCVLVDTGILPHKYANDVFRYELSPSIRAAVERPDDPKGLEFDAIKGNYAWMEKRYEDDGSVTVADKRQGDFGTMPVPHNDEEMDQLVNLKAVTLAELVKMITGNTLAAALLNVANTPNKVTPDVDNTPDVVTPDAGNTANTPNMVTTSETTVTQPIPLSSVPITTCIEQNAPATGLPLQNNTLKPVINDTCVKKPSSSRYVRGRYDTFDRIKALKDPLERKRGLVFRMTWDLGRMLLESEAPGVAERYVKLKMNHTDPPDWAALTEQFTQVIRFVGRTWDAQLAFGGGPASTKFDFVNDLDMEANFAPLLEKRIPPERIIETMKVVLFLAFEVKEPERGKEETELEHQRRVVKYRFTLGPDRVREYIISAREQGAKWSASIDPVVISACLGTAARLRWIWKLQTFSPGKFHNGYGYVPGFCNRYVPGPQNPMQADFLAMHRARVNSYDPPMCFFADCSPDDMTPLSVACLNAAQAHAESEWPPPVQPAGPTEPWTLVVAPEATQEPSAGAPTVTPFFDSNMEPSEYDPSVDQLAYDYDDSADQPADEYVVRVQPTGATS